MNETVVPVSNSFFRRDTITVNLRFRYESSPLRANSSARRSTGPQRYTITHRRASISISRIFGAEHPLFCKCEHELPAANKVVSPSTTQPSIFERLRTRKSNDSNFACARQCKTRLHIIRVQSIACQISKTRTFVDNFYWLRISIFEARRFTPFA